MTDDPYIPTHEDYMTYNLMLADKVSNAAIVAHFGPRKAAALSLRYQADKAAGTFSFVILLTALLLAGCATPDVQCDMRVDYEHITPIPQKGTVRLDWEFLATLDRNVNGVTRCQFGNCRMYLKQQPDFRSVCDLAKFGHEVVHALGAHHEE